MAQAYALEPNGPAGRYHVQPGLRLEKLAEPQNPPYHRGRTSSERLGRMGHDIS
jgi:hypothetical protein